ncbi:procollagen galactosyltransferase 1-like isoform X2 [Lineus longissimus]
MRSLYHTVDLQVDNSTTVYDGELGPSDWTAERFTNVIQLRQAALSKARKIWADYLLMIDADNIIVNRKTLNILMEQEKTVIAPMMNCTSASLYSNFWGDITAEGYYRRSDNYISVIRRAERGVFEVPMVHSTLLINLNHKDSRKLSYDPTPPNYEGPHDDIIRFAFSAKYSNVKMYVVNTDFFGYLAKPLREEETLESEKALFTHLKLEATVESNGTSLASSKFIKVPPRKKDKLGFDKVYVINLRRRPERRKRMVEALDYLGIEAEFIDAVDGKQLNETYLDNLGVKMLPNYADPHTKRAMTYGEIGCFLSHYNVWMDVVKNDYGKIIIFEDDCRFEPLFRSRFDHNIQDAYANVPDWDLIYLGRKILQLNDEKWVDNADHLVRPQYSYWTLAYALTLTGARKLLGQKPLGKLVPVDEYLPIMYDKHPTVKWSSEFEPRDLVTLSTAPLLIHPTHYTGQENYISDTEMSKTIDDSLKARPRLSNDEL